MDWKSRVEEDAETLHDTSVWCARRSLRAMTAKFEMRVDVTPLLFCFLWLFRVEWSAVDDNDDDDEDVVVDVDNDGMAITCSSCGVCI